MLIKVGDDKEELKGIRNFNQKKKKQNVARNIFFLIKKKKWKKHGISMLDYLNCYMSPKSC